MKKEEIIELGTRLGLPFNEKDNYKGLLDRDFVVFNGCNNQRFSFDGHELTDDEIYKEMGKALIEMGKRQKCLEISRVLSIM
jgi:hypothetical protein